MRRFNYQVIVFDQIHHLPFEKVSLSNENQARHRYRLQPHQNAPREPFSVSRFRRPSFNSCMSLQNYKRKQCIVLLGQEAQCKSIRCIAPIHTLQELKWKQDFNCRNILSGRISLLKSSICIWERCFLPHWGCNRFLNRRKGNRKPSILPYIWFVHIDRMF